VTYRCFIVKKIMVRNVHTHLTLGGINLILKHCFFTPGNNRSTMWTLFTKMLEHPMILNTK